MRRILAENDQYPTDLLIPLNSFPLTIGGKRELLFEVREELLFTRLFCRPNHFEILPCEVFVTGIDQIEHLAPEWLFKIVEIIFGAGVRV